MRYEKVKADEDREQRARRAAVAKPDVEAAAPAEALVDEAPAVEVPAAEVAEEAAPAEAVAAE